MAGYVAMSRDWQDHDIFAGDEFSRRDAWAWLIANAAWRTEAVVIGRRKVEIQRGEMTHSVRFLAEKWGWSKSAVARFLTKLQKEKMVEIRAVTSGTVSGTVCGTETGTVQSVISICNYDKFQTPGKGERDSSGDSQRDSLRDKEEEYKPVKPEEEVTAQKGAAPLVFQGKVVRLNQRDFDEWQANFPDLDLRAVLQARDDWLATEADEQLRKKWYIATSNYLANQQQKAKAARRQASRGLEMPC